MSRTTSGNAHRVKSNSGEKKDKQTTNGNHHKDVKIDESSSSDDDEPIRAPIQLKIEFVNSILFRQWELAKKLCQFMLMYEPDNNEAKQYAPLIEYMLAQEQSSSSSSSSSSDDDDDDTSDDDDDGNDSSTSSSSSSSDNEDEQATDTDDVKVPKPVNASLSHKCSYH